jgi:hypothetical protein
VEIYIAPYIPRMERCRVPVTFRYDLFCHWLRGFKRETSETERPDGSMKCPSGHKVRGNLIGVKAIEGVTAVLSLSQ